MSLEKWSVQLQMLTLVLRPHIGSFYQDDPIPFCLKRRLGLNRLEQRRSDLMKYLKSFMSSRLKKSERHAVDLLENGDQNFKMKLFDASLSCYTQCLLYAPKNWTKLSYVYTKRSVALQLMGHYQESVGDIEMAIASGIPSLKLPQLYLEKAKCLILLGEHDEAEKVLSEVSLILASLPKESPECESMKKEILNISKWKEINGEKYRKNINEWKLPVFKDRENPNFPSASNSLEVRYNINKGRYVTAKCPIKTGEVLFVEKPFSFVVHENYCAACCKATAALIPCFYCVDIQFCSTKCRDKSWTSFHKFECGFLNLLKDTGIALLALRTLLQAASSFGDLKNKAGRLKNSEKFTKNNTLFSSDVYENVYNLQTHAHIMEKEDLLQYALTATLISLYLCHHTNYAEGSDENVKFCANMLLRHITQLVSNAHAITTIKLTPQDGNSVVSLEEQEQIGSAIYPSVSIMNHSCDPSIIHCFHGCHIIVRACKDIEKGEEVFNSYGVHCRRMERSKRQELLKSQYYFDCKCIPCCEKFDPYDIRNSLKCDHCKGPVVEDRIGESQYDVYQSLLCLNCSRHVLPQRKINVTKMQIAELIECGETKLNENDVGGALQAFTKAWKFGRTILYKFHKDLSYSANQIALCLFILGDLERCVTIFRCSLLSVQGRFGQISSEFAFESKKFGDLIRFYCSSVLQNGLEEKAEEFRLMGLSYYDISEKVFRLLYGADHPIINEIHMNKLSFK